MFYQAGPLTAQTLRHGQQTQSLSLAARAGHFHSHCFDFLQTAIVLVISGVLGSFERVRFSFFSIVNVTIITITIIIIIIIHACKVLFPPAA